MTPPMLTYLDFEITLGTLDKDAYPVAVRSPAGETRTSWRLPFDAAALQMVQRDLRAALWVTGRVDRHLLPVVVTKTSQPPDYQQRIRLFGKELFNALFSAEVRTLYYASQMVTQNEHGLRIKLICLAPELLRIPWELLYDPRAAEYVCLSRHTPIVRYLEVAQPPRPLTIKSPLQVLGIAVSPQDREPLDLAREKAQVEAALHPLQGRLELTWLAGQTWQDLLTALRTKAWHIVHFIGHGAFDESRNEGQLLFADEQGDAHLLNAEQVARLFADHPTLRLVLLNACEGARSGESDMFTGTATTLIRRGIPAVLAMQYAITDQAAIEFSQAFYRALVDDLPVDGAVNEARKALSLALPTTLEWATPILYMRSPDGRLWESATSTLAKTGQTKEEAPMIQTTIHNSQVGEVININTLKGGLKIQKG